MTYSKCFKKLKKSMRKLKKISAKCHCSRVIFGEINKELPDKCLLRFDMEIEELIQKNRLKGAKEYFEHEDHKKASCILKKDKTAEMILKSEF